jgi:diguanylate cyclase (GGDEF)-like protein
MIILNQCGDSDGALSEADRLRTGLWSVLESGPSRIRVSASVGVAVAPPADITDLMSRADAALYEAKRSGKNLAVLA